jgi:hypothetical protein
MIISSGRLDTFACGATAGSVIRPHLSAPGPTCQAIPHSMSGAMVQVFKELPGVQVCTPISQP